MPKRIRVWLMLTLHLATPATGRQKILFREFANKALQIEPSLAEARASLAYVKLYYDWDWRGAEEELQRAIAVNPNYATAHHWFSVLLTAQGRHDEALSEIGRAHELDPLSVPINTDIGFEL